MNFVLVHGTWHGGWQWRDVRHILRAAGHQVFTPSCTGCGDRVHLDTPEVGLQTHVDDIKNLILAEELNDVILVGHSFAGVTITTVVDQLGDRIKELVYLDALVPAGDVITCVPRDKETGQLPDWWREREKHFLNGHQMVLWNDYPVEMLVPTSATEHIARLKKLITTHPAKQWSDQYALKNDGFRNHKRSYVHCSGQEYKESSIFMWGEAKKPGWDYYDIDTPRNCMMTHPDVVAELLLKITKS